MNKRLLILIISVVVILSSKKSHAQEPTPDVVGGQAAANQYPFFVSLIEPTTFGPPYFPFCGGSLIKSQWILTAAHCVVDFSTGQNEDSIDILVNMYSTNNPNPTMQRITSDYIIRHPNFDVTGRTLLGDIALIHIKNPATGPAINLIDPTDRQYEKPFNKVEVIGFGIFDTTNLGAQPDTLQIAEIRVIPNTLANQIDRYAGLIDTTMICAGRIDTSATGAAAGDSGGPLFDIDSAGNKIQIGIVSFGNDFYSTSQFPGVYTRVSSYTDWIEQSILNYENGVGINKNALKKFQLNNGDNYIEAVVPSHLQENYTVKIFDLNGKEIIKEELYKNENTIRIQTDTWSSGMYIINIFSEQTVFESQKIIK